MTRDDLVALTENRSVSLEEKAERCIATAAAQDDPAEAMVYLAAGQTFALLAQAFMLGMFQGPDGAAAVMVR